MTNPQDEAFARWWASKTYQEKVLLPVYQEAFAAGYRASQLPAPIVPGASMGRTK